MFCAIGIPTERTTCLFNRGSLIVVNDLLQVLICSFCMSLLFIPADKDYDVKDKDYFVRFALFFRYETIYAAAAVAGASFVLTAPVGFLSTLKSDGLFCLLILLSIAGYMAIYLTGLVILCTKAPNMVVPEGFLFCLFAAAVTTEFAFWLGRLFGLRVRATDVPNVYLHANEERV